MDCSIEENLNNRKIEENKYNCASLVLYMQKEWGDSCIIIIELWNMAFSMFGVRGVMPKGVIDLLTC